MDRVYVTSKRLEPVRSLGLTLFRDNVVLVSTTRELFRNTLLEMMAQERRGGVVDRTAVKDTCQMLTTLGTDKRCFYGEEFETLCLQHLAEFYQLESQRLLDENSASEYIGRVNRFISEETERIIFYLDQTIEERLIRLLENEFISRHIKSIVTMESPRVHQMLKLNQVEDLVMTCKLYQGLPNCLSIIADFLSNYLREQGNALVVETGDERRHIASLVQNLIDLKYISDNILETAVNYDATLEQRIDSDFEYIISLNQRIPELFSLFIDDQLKDGKILDVQQIVLVKGAMMFLRYLKEKDLFERYYTHLKDTLLEMDNSCVRHMLRLNQYEELGIMYKLYQRVPNGLSIVADCVSNYLREQGKALAIESGGRDRNIPSLIQNLVDLKDKFDTCLKTALNSDKTFRQRIDSDFEYIINLNERSPEYFSLFINEQLKNVGQNLADQEVEVLLDKATMLLCYLKDKDTFEQYYRQHLARRLLSNKLVSDDFEKYILSGLENKFGSHLKSKFEIMVKDISLSNTISEDFRLYIVQKQLNLNGIDLAVRVLTSSVWPIQSATNQCNLSSMLREAYQCFQKFYLSKHNGRLLTLQPIMGSADLTSVFYGKPKDDDTNGELLLTTCMTKERKHILHVSTYQMVILMLFNTKDSWSFEVRLPFD
jgi:hypothetical protein